MFNRRKMLSFIGLGGLATTAVGAVSPTPTQRTIKVLDTYVAGFSYYQGGDVIARIAPGDVLLLKREPENLYDELAIEVYWNSHKLGYVPRIANVALSQLMDEGSRISACVGSHKAKSWQTLGLVVNLAV